MIRKILRYVREQQLVVPGDRVAVAVSGGADSVSLLRALLELRGQLGAVLAVAHFNHKIRGAEADEDEEFVRQLAAKFQMEFYCGSADAPAYAREQKMSLETAARELRHAWFAELVRGHKADKIATAHTQDDQAETVLMRILRGTGTRGLAGIAPWQTQKALIRPLLSVTREEVEAYLKHLGQSWRDDSSNKDLRHMRNRVRHELMPLLQRDYNPALRQTLADLAEVARAEEEYWENELVDLKARLVRSGKPSRSGRSNRQESVLAVDLSAFAGQPLAVQRRLLRAIAEDLGATLEFKHVQEMLELASRKKTGLKVELPSGLVVRNSMRELQVTRDDKNERPANYSYPLTIPGQVRVAELGTIVRTRIMSLEQFSGYNSGLLDRTLLAPELKVRNWRPGDRFFPAHTRSPKKVKELLQPGRLGHELLPAERKNWPVVESAGEIVWMRGFAAPEALSAKSGDAVLIEEVEIA